MAKATYRGKVIVPGTLLTTVLTKLYTAPTDLLHGIMTNVQLNNLTSSDIVVNGHLVERGDTPSTDNNYWHNITVPAGLPMPFEATIMFNPGAEIWFQAAANDSANLYISGAEVTE